MLFLDAIHEMKALQRHLVEKSDQVERLSEHVQKLKYELKQQTSTVCCVFALYQAS